jgi:hypothetical protein
LDIVPGGRVYNLRVEGQPEFFAGGVLVHNCEVFPQGGHDDQVDALAAAYARLASVVPQGRPAAGGRRPEAAPPGVAAWQGGVL